MKTLKCRNVQAAEAGDEIFQVTFETEFDSLKDYFLIQRGFEFEEVVGNQIYIESDDMTFTGYNIIEEAFLERNRFYIRLNDKDNSEIELLFSISDNKYQKIKKTLKIIFTRFHNLKVQ